MKAIPRVFAVLAALVLLAYAPVLADQAPSPSPTQAPPAAPAASAGQAQSQSASGELVSVDTKAKTLIIKAAAGEMTFKFDDSTKISGGKDAAGLATMKGSQATVQYKKDGAAMLATSIDVKAAK
jgi:hypothetical protein